MELHSQFTLHSPSAPEPQLQANLATKSTQPCYVYREGRNAPTSHAGSSTPGLSSSATVAVAAYLATAFLLVLSSNGKLPKLLTPPPSPDASADATQARLDGVLDRLTKLVDAQTPAPGPSPSPTPPL